MKVFTINKGEAHSWQPNYEEVGDELVTVPALWEKDSINYILNEIVARPETDQATTQEVSVGDVVIIHSRGYYRTAIVNHVARTKITAGYTTQGALDDMRTKIATPDKWNWISTLVQDGGEHHPTITNKSTNEFWLV